MKIAVTIQNNLGTTHVILEYKGLENKFGIKSLDQYNMDSLGLNEFVQDAVNAGQLDEKLNTLYEWVELSLALGFNVKVKLSKDVKRI